MRPTLFILSLLLISWSSISQIDPLYSQYLNNPVLINPAYTGMNKYLNVMTGFRKQWAGFDGSPATVSVSAHSSLLDNKMGTGLIISQDNFGEYSNTLVQGTYGYKIKVRQYDIISFGLQAGIMNFKSDNSKLNILDPGDPNFETNQNTTKPTFGAGIIYKAEKLYVGLSVPRLLKVKESFGVSKSQLYSQHFYGFASYTYILTRHVWFKPGILVRGVANTPLSTDLNIQFNIDQRYVIGALTRNFNTYGLLLQFKLTRYRLGYVFELPTNRSVGTNYTTHDIMFGINLALFKSHDVLAVSGY